MNPEIMAALQQAAQEQGGGQEPQQPQAQGQGQPPLAEEMYTGATGMMQNAQPNEANLILKALIARLKQNPVAGAPVQQGV